MQIYLNWQWEKGPMRYINLFGKGNHFQHSGLTQFNREGPALNCSMLVHSTRRHRPRPRALPSGFRPSFTVRPTSDSTSHAVNSARRKVEERRKDAHMCAAEERERERERERLVAQGGVSQSVDRGALKRREGLRLTHLDLRLHELS